VNNGYIVGFLCYRVGKLLELPVVPCTELLGPDSGWLRSYEHITSQRSRKSIIGKCNRFIISSLNATNLGNANRSSPFCNGAKM
jgi:hypothetical protein